MPKKNYKNEALEMAIADFEKFCKYAGVNDTQLMVCIERNRGLSYGQISSKLQIPRTTVSDICDRCFSEATKGDKAAKKQASGKV